MAKNNYVNNAEFTAIIKEYRNKKAAAEAEGKPEPRIPEKAGAILMLIADRYSRRPIFRNYSYRDEMIANGVEAAVRAFGNFDPDRGTSPLSYFTQCVHFAFIGTITKEKKQLYTRMEMIRSGAVDFMEILEHDDGISSTQKDFLMEFLDRNDNEIEFGFLNKKTKAEPKKEKVIESPLDEFFGE